MIRIIHSRTAQVLTMRSPGSAGYDFHLTQEVVLKPGDIKKIDLGFGLEMPHNVFATIEARSSMGQCPVDVFRGVIDSDFRSNIFTILRNFSRQTVTIPGNRKIGQLVFHFRPQLQVFDAGQQVLPQGTREERPEPPREQLEIAHF